MKKSITSCLLVLIISFLTIYSSCEKPPYKPDYKNIKGFVIAKESCNTDDAQDYWLIDFTVLPNPPKVGDTIVLNGITYTNVLKTKQLDQRLKQIGLRVSIDYKVISANLVTTTGCNVAVPLTHKLRELFIINQGEIR